jgi:uncharacterized membrane protein
MKLLIVFKITLDFLLKTPKKNNTTNLWGTQDNTITKVEHKKSQQNTKCSFELQHPTTCERKQKEIYMLNFKLQPCVPSQSSKWVTTFKWSKSNSILLKIEK